MMLKPKQVAMAVLLKLMADTVVAATEEATATHQDLGASLPGGDLLPGRPWRTLHGRSA